MSLYIKITKVNKKIQANHFTIRYIEKKLIDLSKLQIKILTFAANFYYRIENIITY